MTRLLLVLALSCSSGPALSVCEVKAFEEHLGSAKAVFVATITAASIPNPSSLADGSPYRINYSFFVRESLKGDPSSIASLFVIRSYDDPLDDVAWDRPEETNLIPGDNVIVIAHGERDVQVGSCTPSRQIVDSTWVRRARAALAD